MTLRHAGSRLLGGGRLRRAGALYLLLGLAAGCTPPPPHNVLLLIADDVGVPRVGAYGAHPEPSRTPTLNALAARGVRFERAWATPMCSPSRAAILTGSLPSRNGIGAAIHNGRPGQRQGLDLTQDTLPRRLAARGVRSFAVGKWHLSGGIEPDTTHALRAGFAHYSGYPGNPPGAQGYFTWTKHVNGMAERARGYLTSDTVDDAIEQVGSSPEPWFGWVAFHAVHAPLHAPPAESHSESLGGAPTEHPIAHYDAALEAMDREIGRLLAGVAPDVMQRTTVVFVSDNGTSKHGVRAPSRSAKRSLFEGGVRVPLIVAGAAVPAESAGRASAALVHVTDLFSTIAALFGADPSAADAQSLVRYFADPAALSLRRVLYTERFLPNGGPPNPERSFRAARDARYKLIALPDVREFYDLESDPGETHDMLTQAGSAPPAATLARLERAIESQRGRRVVALGRGGRAGGAHGMQPARGMQARLWREGSVSRRIRSTHAPRACARPRVGLWIALCKRSSSKKTRRVRGFAWARRRRRRWWPVRCESALLQPR